MTEEGTKITIRMGSEEIQSMEDFMADNEIGNRSDFIRDAIKEYIMAKRNPAGAGMTEGGLFIRLNEVQMATLEMLREDGICYDIEEFVRKCVTDRIVSPESEKDSIDRAFKAAQMTSRMK